MRKQWTIHMYYVITFLFWTSLYTYQPTMSPYLESIGINYSMIGIIGGSYGFTQMLLRIPLGILSDRLGKRKVFIVGGLLISALSTVILYFVTSPAMILFGRGLAGVAASSWVVFTVLFASYFESGKAASSISFLTMCNNIGQVLGMLAGGIAAGYLGYRFPFLLGAIVGFAGLILSFFVRENVPVRSNPPKIMELLSVAKNKNLMVMSILAIITQMILFGTTHTFTPMVAVNLGMTSQEIGYLAAMGNVPRIVSAMLCGILLVRKVNVKKLLVLSFVFLAVGSAATPLCTHMWTLTLTSIAIGFGAGMSMTTFLSLCTRGIDDRRRSAAMGFFQAIYGIGMFAGPVVVGVFADHLGLAWGFLFSALIAAAGMIGCLKFVEAQ